MEMFDSLLGRGAWRMEDVFNITPLSPPQKQHVARIYAGLSANVIATAAGVYIQLNVFRLPPFLSLMISIGCAIGLSTTNEKAMRENKVLTKARALCFGGFGLLNGMLIAGYLHAVHNYIGSQIIPTAFLAAVTVFSCFSAAALIAKQRSYLYLGALLASATSYLMLASLVHIFFRFKVLDDILLWGGLFLYLGFVVYDTQLAIAQFDAGNADYLIHALKFYVNFLSIFVRIVAILSEKTAENSRSKRDNE